MKTLTWHGIIMDLSEHTMQTHKIKVQKWSQTMQSNKEALNQINKLRVRILNHKCHTTAQTMENKLPRNTTWLCSGVASNHLWLDGISGSTAPLWKWERNCSGMILEFGWNCHGTIVELSLNYNGIILELSWNHHRIIILS